MCPLGNVAVDPGVRSQLRAALFPAPGLRALYERPPDAVPTVRWLHVPALQKPDRASGVATVGVGAQTDLHEANESTIPLGDNGGHRQSAAGSQSGQRLGFFAKLGPRRIWPQTSPQLGERLHVADSDPSQLHSGNLPHATCLPHLPQLGVGPASHMTRHLLVATTLLWLSGGSCSPFDPCQSGHCGAAEQSICGCFDLPPTSQKACSSALTGDCSGDAGVVALAALDVCLTQVCHTEKDLYVWLSCLPDGGLSDNCLGTLEFHIRFAFRDAGQ